MGIKEKVFNDDFRGIVIYADRVPVHGDFMEGVMLYDERTQTVDAEHDHCVEGNPRLEPRVADGHAASGEWQHPHRRCRVQELQESGLQHL